MPAKKNSTNKPPTSARSKESLHPRNRFRGRYDFAKLTAVSPALAPFVRLNAYGDTSIDYADPAAVKALNQALLIHGYGVKMWDIPKGYLCPPIPGRSDYIHHLADLLAAGGAIPREKTVRVLDIGVGANCIYPLIGAAEYGWRFVGADIDPIAVRWAGTLAAAFPGQIDCRLQSSATQCFRGVIKPGERFAASMCNPPFHASAAEAATGTRRKIRNLGGKDSALNFGGTSRELWCEGGELAFIQRMIAQSAEGPDCCEWFTTLVAKREHLPSLRSALRKVRATDVKTIDMAQGQKQSRILAWTFRDGESASRLP